MPKLDDIIARLALAKAREFMKRGHIAEQAVEYACTGAWLRYRERVLKALLAENLSNDRS